VTVTATSSATVIIGITTKPSSSKRAITTGMLTMIADLTDSNRILAASIIGAALFGRGKIPEQVGDVANGINTSRGACGMMSPMEKSRAKASRHKLAGTISFPRR